MQREIRVNLSFPQCDTIDSAYRVFLCLEKPADKFVPSFERSPLCLNIFDDTLTDLNVNPGLVLV